MKVFLGKKKNKKQVSCALVENEEKKSFLFLVAQNALGREENFGGKMHFDELQWHSLISSYTTLTHLHIRHLHDN